MLSCSLTGLVLRSAPASSKGKTVRTKTRILNRFTYCAEAGQSLIVQEGLHGVEADDHDVHSQVELDTIEK